MFRAHGTAPERCHARSGVLPVPAPRPPTFAIEHYGDGTVEVFVHASLTVANRYAHLTQLLHDLRSDPYWRVVRMTTCATDDGLCVPLPSPPSDERECVAAEFVGNLTACLPELLHACRTVRFRLVPASPDGVTYGNRRVRVYDFASLEQARFEAHRIRLTHAPGTVCFIDINHVSCAKSTSDDLAAALDAAYVDWRHAADASMIDVEPATITITVQNDAKNLVAQTATATAAMTAAAVASGRGGGGSVDSSASFDRGVFGRCAPRSAAPPTCRDDRIAPIDAGSDDGALHRLSQICVSRRGKPADDKAPVAHEYSESDSDVEEKADATSEFNACNVAAKRATGGRADGTTGAALMVHLLTECDRAAPPTTPRELEALAAGRGGRHGSSSRRRRCVNVIVYAPPPHCERQTEAQAIYNERGAKLFHAHTTGMRQVCAARPYVLPPFDTATSVASPRTTDVASPTMRSAPMHCGGAGAGASNAATLGDIVQAVADMALLRQQVDEQARVIDQLRRASCHAESRRACAVQT